MSQELFSREDLDYKYFYSAERNMGRMTFAEYVDYYYEENPEEPGVYKLKEKEGNPMNNMPKHPYDGLDENGFREYAKKIPDGAVNPAHYKEIVPGMEYFDMMDYILKDWKGSQAHALGNAYKYLMRLGKKDDPAQELGKAIWYLERLRNDIKTNGY